MEEVTDRKSNISSLFSSKQRINHAIKTLVNKRIYQTAQNHVYVKNPDQPG